MMMPSESDFVYTHPCFSLQSNNASVDGVAYSDDLPKAFPLLDIPHDDAQFLSLYIQVPSNPHLYQQPETDGHAGEELSNNYLAFPSNEPVEPGGLTSDFRDILAASLYSDRDYVNECYTTPDASPGSYQWALAGSPRPTAHSAYDPSPRPDPFQAYPRLDAYTDIMVSSPAAVEPTFCISPALLSAEPSYHLTTHAQNEPHRTSARKTLHPSLATEPSRAHPYSLASSPTTSLTSLSSSPPRASSPILHMSTRRNAVAPSRSTSAAPTPPTARPTSSRWKCPHCPYVQHTRRMPDLKRHIGTHTRGTEPLWVCCGVPLCSAREYGVPDAVLAAPDGVFEFAGQSMVGGCRRAFSRRDALTRHLRREKGRCWGHALAEWQPGNQLGVGAL